MVNCNKCGMIQIPNPEGFKKSIQIFVSIESIKNSEYSKTL